MSELTLKPCPFCGSNDLNLMETVSGVGGLSGEYYVTWLVLLRGWRKRKHQEKSKVGLESSKR